MSPWPLIASVCLIALGALLVLDGLRRMGKL